MIPSKDVALVLSSGGARGLAHIGAIEELLSHGYRITSIAGCSMGALIGGVYAAGKLEEFREWMKGIDRKKMLELIDFSFSINHLVKGDRIIEAIRASISLPSFYKPVQRDGMVLIDGGVLNPIPLNRVKRQKNDILIGVDVSGHDYKSQWEENLIISYSL